MSSGWRRAGSPVKEMPSKVGFAMMIMMIPNESGKTMSFYYFHGGGLEKEEKTEMLILYNQGLILIEDCMSFD